MRNFLRLIIIVKMRMMNPIVMRIVMKVKRIVMKVMRMRNLKRNILNKNKFTSHLFEAGLLLFSFKKVLKLNF